jgi:hypothetical protein
MALASLSLSACLSPEQPGICNCAKVGETTVTIPTAGSIDPPVLIVNAWTDHPCTVTDDNVNKVVVQYVGGAGTCQVGVGLTNGATYSFSVEFQEIAAGGCCAGLNRAVDASVPQLADTGADAGSPG